MQERLQSALERLPELEAIKWRKGSQAEQARASRTDADAGVMKMADGGYRPAYNTQYASDCDSQVIVGVEVSTSGSDMAQAAPMVEQTEQRLGSAPQKMRVDGGFPAHAQIDAVADKTEVYAPLPEARAKKDDKGNEAQQDKHEPKPDESAALASWRQRMASDETEASTKTSPASNKPWLARKARKVPSAKSSGCRSQRRVAGPAALGHAWRSTRGTTAGQRPGSTTGTGGVSCGSAGWAGPVSGSTGIKSGGGSPAGSGWDKGGYWGCMLNSCWMKWRTAARPGPASLLPCRRRRCRTTRS